MAESRERGAGKLAAAPNSPSVSKAKGKRVQGGRVVESRYLQYEKKTKEAPTAETLKPSGELPGGGRKAGAWPSSRGGRVVESRYLQYEKKTKEAPTAETLKPSGELPGGGRKAGAWPSSRDDNRMGMRDLQSTLLEGHGTAPPDLDLSVINDKSMVRKAPQLDSSTLEKAESASFAASRKKSPDLPQAMEMMESHTLLLSLLTVKMENNLAQLEEKAEKHLSIMSEEMERLQRQVYELKQKLLLSQKQQQLANALHIQMELLGPFKTVAEHFKQQYKTLATALDSTRHELPMKEIHLQGGGQALLDALQPALRTTCELLGELGIHTPDTTSEAADIQTLRLLDELKDLTIKKDLELRRTIVQVLELSAEASKEAAFQNQEVWEEAQGTAACSQWYFNPDGGSRDPPGELWSTVASENSLSCAL